MFFCCEENLLILNLEYDEWIQLKTIVIITYAFNIASVFITLILKSQIFCRSTVKIVNIRFKKVFSPALIILSELRPSPLAFSTRWCQVKFCWPAHVSPRRTGQPPSWVRISLASLRLLDSMCSSSMQLLYRFLTSSNNDSESGPSLMGENQTWAFA